MSTDFVECALPSDAFHDGSLVARQSDDSHLDGSDSGWTFDWCTWCVGFVIIVHSAAELRACMTPPAPTANSDRRTIKAGPARRIQPCSIYHPVRGYHRLLFDPVLYLTMIVSDAFLILLLACIAAYSSHLLLLEYAEAKLPRWMRNHQTLCYIPIMSVCLSIAVVIASALTKPSESPQCSEDFKINADIGGTGVLLGLFLPSALLVVVLLSGHWKAEPSGAEELCMAHMNNCADSARSALPDSKFGQIEQRNQHPRRSSRLFQH